MKQALSAAEQRGAATLALARHAQDMLDTLFLETPNPPPEHALAQCGLRDGYSIVVDYIHHGELGLAIHHLLYMVDELELKLPEDEKTAIEALRPFSY